MYTHEFTEMFALHDVRQKLKFQSYMLGMKEVTSSIIRLHLDLQSPTSSDRGSVCGLWSAQKAGLGDGRRRLYILSFFCCYNQPCHVFII